MGSMGTIEDCYDNAPMEAFWGRMQVEVLNRKKWITIVKFGLTPLVAGSKPPQP